MGCGRGEDGTKWSVPYNDIITMRKTAKDLAEKAAKGGL